MGTDPASRAARDVSAGPTDGSRPGQRIGIGPDTPLQALAQRVRALSAVLSAGAAEVGASEPVDPAREIGRLLEHLVESLCARPQPDRIWLTVAALCGAMPTRDDVDEVRRLLELADPRFAAGDLLDWCLSVVQASGAPMASIEIVVHRVVVDVDFTARHDLHTGIQRVVRQTVPLWQREHDVLPVAWTSGRGAMRQLDIAESGRVFRWADDRATGGTDRWSAATSAADDRVVIPWRSVLVIPEVPQPDITPRLAALAAVSGNRMVAVGHDAIPLVAADTLDLAEPDKYMAYLSALKHARRVAGVSHSSTAEFAAFASMLAAQGLVGPSTTAVPLPVDFAVGHRAPSSVDTLAGADMARSALFDSDAEHGSEVVVVGSHDARKNHQAVLHAAELLWKRGIRFRLSFIGSGGSNQVFLDRLEVLQRRGRDVRLRTGLSDARLRTAVAEARFTVFPSLHEGYGLPVAESLALGTPVITTSYGSTAEIAADGGALVVDPHDASALASAMCELLTDDTLLARLHDEISRRPPRTWADYAGELWSSIVAPELAAQRTTPWNGTAT